MLYRNFREGQQKRAFPALHSTKRLTRNFFNFPISVKQRYTVNGGVAGKKKPRPGGRGGVGRGRCGSVEVDVADFVLRREAVRAGLVLDACQHGNVSGFGDVADRWDFQLCGSGDLGLYRI